MGASVSSTAQVPVESAPRGTVQRPPVHLPTGLTNRPTPVTPTYTLPRPQVSTSVGVSNNVEVHARSVANSSTSNTSAATPGTTTRSQSTTTTHSTVRPSTSSSTLLKTFPPVTSQRQSTSSSTPVNEEITQCPFKKGDKVKLIAISEDGLKSLVNSDRGWNPKAIKYLNQTGIVNGIGDNREVTFDFNDSQIRWTFYSEPTNYFLIDDVVKLTESENALKKLQRGHGEFVPEMSNFLGRRGVVCKIFTDGDLSVSFDGGTWTLNPRSVVILSRYGQPIHRSRRIDNQPRHVTTSFSPPNKVTNQCPFAIGDQVKLVSCKLKNLQKGHGGWNPRLVQSINKTGIVIGITENQDAIVLFNYSRICWTLNPVALRRHYAGDIVKVVKDVIKIRSITTRGSDSDKESYNIRGETGVVIDTNNKGDLVVKSGAHLWRLELHQVVNLSELERIENRKKMEGAKDKKRESISWKDWINQLINENSEINPSLTSKGIRSTKTDKDSNIHYLIEKNRRLQEQLTKLEEANSCGICLENPKNVTFLCGHGTCSSCANNLTVCHMCRRYLSYKIPTY